MLTEQANSVFKSRMRPLLLLLLPTLIMIAALGSGYSQSQATVDDNGPIRVGVFVDLSGQTTSFGESTLNGIKMAAEEINGMGGISGRQIELVVEDDEGRPEKAATVVRKLINQDKVHVVLGEVASSNTLAAAPIAQAAKVPMIAPAATHEKVTEVGDYIFRTCFIDPFQGEALAKFAATTLKARRAAILFDANSDYSRKLAQTFEERFIKLDGQILLKQAYMQTDRDFRNQLKAIVKVKPDVIFVPGYYGQVGVIAKQARELKIKTPLLGGDGWDAPQLWDIGGKALNGSYMSNHFSVDDPSLAIQYFIAGYKSRHEDDSPDAIAALGYDAMNVLADALRRAGTTDGPALRDAIAQTANFPGVTGNITIDKSRNAIKPVIIFELRDGKFMYKESIQPD